MGSPRAILRERIRWYPLRRVIWGAHTGTHCRLGSKMHRLIYLAYIVGLLLLLHILNMTQASQTTNLFPRTIMVFWAHIPTLPMPFIDRLHLIDAGLMLPVTKKNLHRNIIGFCTYRDFCSHNNYASYPRLRSCRLYLKHQSFLFLSRRVLPKFM